MNKFIKSFCLNSVHLLAGYLAFFILLVIRHSLIARHYSIGDFGIYVFIQSVCLMFFSVMDEGIERYYLKEKKNVSYFYEICITKLVYSFSILLLVIMIMLLLTISGYDIGVLYGALIFSIYRIFYSILGSFKVYFRLNNKMYLESFFLIFLALLALILTFFVIVKDYSIVCVFAANLIAITVTLALAFIFFNPIGLTNMSLTAQAVLSSIHNGLLYIIRVGLYSVSKYLVTIILFFLFFEEIVGIFGVALKIFSYFELVVGIIAIAAIPSIKQLVSLPYWKIKKVIGPLYLFMFLLGSLIALVLVFALDPLMTALFSTKYLDSVILAKILLLAVPFIIIDSFNNLYLEFVNKIQQIVKIMIIGSGIHIVLSIILIKYYANFGAAISILVFFVLMAIWKTMLIGKMERVDANSSK